MNDFDIIKYLDIPLRRKYWIIIPFLLMILAGSGYILKAPKIYRAKTMILVQQQRVPKDYVRSIVSADMEDRLRTINQQVTSRTNLENIIQEYGLFSGPQESDILPEKKVEILQERIKIEVIRGGRGGNAFSISFQGKDPEKVAQVTNALASNFITENLKIRESYAHGTSVFLADELESITKNLVEKEEMLKEYRSKHIGGLPEQLPTNIQMLNQLQMQLEQLNRNLNAAKSRKLIIQGQITNSKMMESQMSDGSGEAFRRTEKSSSGERERNKDLITLRKELVSLERRYTPIHPDVVQLKQTISKLESEHAKAEGERYTESEVDSQLTKPKKTKSDNALLIQMDQVNLEIEDIKKDIKSINKRIEEYQTRVENTPKRQQDIMDMSRDYDNLKRLYNRMMNRKLEAEVAVNMEAKQKGEQFRIIDPAKIPNIPIKPNVQKLLFSIVIVGLCLGCGLAYIRETMDTSFRRPEDMEEVLQIPIIASLPFTYSSKELRRLKRKKVLTVVSVTMTFLLLEVVMVLSIKGVDTTINFIKDIFIKL